jgi:hypothetical protein
MDEIEPVAWRIPDECATWSYQTDEPEPECIAWSARWNRVYEPLYDSAALEQARIAGMREAMEIVMGGRFLHNEAPDFKFAKKAAEAINRAIEEKEHG